MIAYTYDYDTGSYIGPLRLNVSDLDPRSPDTLLIPGNATLIEPPRCGKNLWPFWRDGRWQVFELVDDGKSDSPDDDYWANL